MASLFLGIAGGALAKGTVYAAVASAIGTAIGSYIDNKYIFPPPDFEGPRLDGLKAQRGSEGMPLNYAIGRAVRVPARVVWVGPDHLIETAQESGGGGGIS